MEKAQGNSPTTENASHLSFVMNSTVSVAIIGGGPCVLMTALLLARGGTRRVVLEKKPATQLRNFNSNW